MKILNILIFFLLISSTEARLNEGKLLFDRLNKINCLHTKFIQKVTNNENVKKEEGELWIKRPKLFKWHLLAPKENIIISNGETIWFYDPLIKQVTISLLKNVSYNIFFKLILNKNPIQINQFNIKRKGNFFFIFPKLKNLNFEKLIIEIDKDGLLKSFSIQEKNNQIIHYKLINQKFDFIKNEKFNFSIPNGVLIDDQR